MSILGKRSTGNKGWAKNGWLLVTLNSFTILLMVDIGNAPLFSWKWTMELLLTSKISWLMLYSCIRICLDRWSLDIYSYLTIFGWIVGKLKEEDREQLIKHFLATEIKQAIFYMKKDAAPGLMVLGLLFSIIFGS